MPPALQQGPDPGPEGGAPRGAVERGRVRPLVALLLLAATMAEFLTGSTPVLQVFANPWQLLLLMGGYGGGALLIRETAIRWGKGWAGVLFLGGAYAVGEEGFGAKTMIDPLHSNIGNQLYSHFLGVNWVPLADLTLFHAAFSIAVPLIIVDVAFPDFRGRPLVGYPGMAMAGASYFLVFSFVSLRTPYQPQPAVYVFLASYALAWIAAAWKVGPRLLQPRTSAPDRGERAFLLLGVWFIGGFFAIGGLGPQLLPWPATAALFVPLAVSVAWYLKKHAGAEESLPKIDFVIGAVSAFVPLDVLLEVTKDPGVLVYTAGVMAVLLLVRRKVRAAPEPKSGSGPGRD